MDQTESAVEIRPLKQSDLAAALLFTQQAQWNQTESDWQRLLKMEPHGCFVACTDARVIGTVTAVTYGTELAWIGMMLVDPDFRGRGIGTRLMQTVLAYLQQSGVNTIKLDATPAGYKLYESLGFVTEAILERWEGVAGNTSPQELSGIDEQTRRLMFELDHRAFGVNRKEVLESLLTDSPIDPLVKMLPTDEELRGFVLARQGGRASYVGPLVATDEHVALELFDGMLDQLAGEKVYVDFHTGFRLNSEALAERGFTKQRTLTRMSYGQESKAGTSKLIFAIAGPELG
jgi:ribosomal protein S18 acetylase RimI-like enzyme